MSNRNKCDPKHVQQLIAVYKDRFDDYSKINERIDEIYKEAEVLDNELRNLIDNRTQMSKLMRTDLAKIFSDIISYTEIPLPIANEMGVFRPEEALKRVLSLATKEARGNQNDEEND